MKKILGLTIAALLVMALVGGGSWAYFSDVETSTGNVFTAGTLNLDLTDTSDDGTEGEAATWVFPAIAPGVSGGGGAGNGLTISNTGTLNGYLDLSSITVTNAENYDVNTDEAETADDADTSDATGGGELGANLLVQIWIDADNDGLVGGGGGTLTEVSIYPAAAIGVADPGTGVLDSIAGSYDLDELVNAGTSTYIALLYDLPGAATNNASQGDSATLTFTVELDQVAD